MLPTNLSSGRLLALLSATLLIGNANAAPQPFDLDNRSSSPIKSSFTFKRNNDGGNGDGQGQSNELKCPAQPDPVAQGAQWVSRQQLMFVDRGCTD